MTTKYQLTIRCTVCGTRFKRIMSADDEDALAALPDPPCPYCHRRPRKRKAFDFRGKAPAVGGSVAVRAVDQTAQIVMEDHKLTDLRSDVREGETMAPKLAPRLQAMADNMFSRPKGRAQNGLFGMPPRAVLQAAVSGRFQTQDTVNPVALHHKRRDAMPVQIVAGDGVRQR